MVKAPNKPNQTVIQFIEQGDMLWQNKRPEIDTRFSRDCENTTLFVERLEKDKDTDKDVDADRDRTGRPVGGHWSRQLEEIDIDFRVSGLPHAVVKQAENFRVRELVKKIVSHPHRQDLQADLQQRNAYNPFSEKSKKMILDMGNVESYLSYARQFQKCNAQNAFFTGIKASFTALVSISLRENKSSRRIHRWQLDILSISNYVIKKVRPHGNRHGSQRIEHFFTWLKELSLF